MGITQTVCAIVISRVKRIRQRTETSLIFVTQPADPLAGLFVHFTAVDLADEFEKRFIHQVQYLGDPACDHAIDQLGIGNEKRANHIFLPKNYGWIPFIGPITQLSCSR